MRPEKYLQLPRSLGDLRLVCCTFPLLSALLLSGCAERQVRVRPWATAIAVRPHLVRPLPTTPLDLTEIEAPELTLECPPLPSPLSISRQPVRPRVPAQPAPEAAGSNKPPAPSLEPELSAQEVAAAQQQIN